MFGGSQKIVDQAKAQGNAWDTGVVPGHLRMELNSTLAEGVKVTCCSEVTSERRVDDEETHRRKSNSGRTRLEPDRLAEDREDRSSSATSHLHGHVWPRWKRQLSAVTAVEPYASRGARTVPGGEPAARRAPTRYCMHRAISGWHCP